MKYLFSVIVLLVTSLVQAQQYQTVIIKSKFDFQDKVDEYRLNTLTKMYMKEYGFNAFLDNETVPDSIASNHCEKLFVDAEASGNMFVTNVTIIMRDCTNKIIYTSPQGQSKDKQYKIAYPQALRQALSGFNRDAIPSGPLSSTPAVKAPPVVAPPVVGAAVLPATTSSELLFAQPTTNGFQLVDQSPKIIFKLLKTSVSNVYLAMRDQQNGIVFQNNGKWYFEYYDADKRISELLSVKF